MRKIEYAKSVLGLIEQEPTVRFEVDGLPSPTNLVKDVYKKYYTKAQKLLR